MSPNEGSKPRDRVEAAARPSRGRHRRARVAGGGRGHRGAGLVPAAQPRLGHLVDAPTRSRPRRPSRRRGRRPCPARPPPRAATSAAGDARRPDGDGSRVRATFEAGRGFPLDRFQTLRARRARRRPERAGGRADRLGQDAGRRVRGRQALAPTGGKVFYTTPLKALSNQKYGDLVRVAVLPVSPPPGAVVTTLAFAPTPTTCAARAPELRDPSPRCASPTAFGPTLRE